MMFEDPASDCAEIKTTVYLPYKRRSEQYGNSATVSRDSDKVYHCLSYRQYFRATIAKQKSLWKLRVKSTERWIVKG